MLRVHVLLATVATACGKLAHAQINHTHSAPVNSTRSVRRLTRAEQTVEANEWWCMHAERQSTLRCKRHRLQQRHQQAVDAAAREAASVELKELLSTAGESALAAMHEETEIMLHGWCALTTSAGLDLCSSGNGQGRRRHNNKKKSKKRHGSGGSNNKGTTAGDAAAELTGGGGSSSSSGGGSGDGSSSGGGKQVARQKKRGIAVLWNAESLSLLRAWWCADRRHMREPRCSRGVRWTRQQPGLSAMRRLFCAQQMPSNATGDGIARLCLGRAAQQQRAAVAAGGSSSTGTGSSGDFTLSSGGRAGVGGGGTRQRRPLKASTVFKLMLALLGLALLCGWRVRHFLIAKRARVEGDSDGMQTASRLSDQVVSAGAATRRRWRTGEKRARLQEQEAG